MKNTSKTPVPPYKTVNFLRLAPSKTINFSRLANVRWTTSSRLAKMRWTTFFSFLEVLLPCLRGGGGAETDGRGARPYAG